MDCKCFFVDQQKGRECALHLGVIDIVSTGKNTVEQKHLHVKRQKPFQTNCTGVNAGGLKQESSFKLGKKQVKVKVYAAAQQEMKCYPSFI